MAVQPGNLPLSITRGIEFPAQVLQCKSDDLTVTGTLVPNVTGTYVLSGTYNGFPLFILAGTPACFCYYSTPATSYIISRTLSNGGLTDFFVPSSPLTEPTGDYIGVGAYTGTATATDHVFDLTGYTAEAYVRRTTNPDAEIYIDLNPSVTDAANGELTIPAISSTVTAALEFTGNFKWDLVLISGGQRIGTFIEGKFPVSDNVTSPLAV